MDLCVFIIFCAMLLASVKHLLNSYFSSSQFELKAKVINKTIVCSFFFFFFSRPLATNFFITFLFDLFV
jgi:hypothetical protein